MERTNRQNPLVWGIIAAVAVFLWNAAVVAGAWAIENYVQTWGGFGLLALGAITLAPLTVAVGSYYSSNRRGCGLGIGLGIGTLVMSIIIVLAAWAIENYVQTWGGFILLAAAVLTLAPVTVGLLVYLVIRCRNEPFRPLDRTPWPPAAPAEEHVVEERERVTRRETTA